MAYIGLEKLLNLYDGYRQVFVVNNHQVLLIQEEGRRYVIQANCPHVSWPLQNAIINNGIITCNKHGWAFNLQSGRGRAANIQTQCDLKQYPIHYEGNTIGICLEE